MTRYVIDADVAIRLARGNVAVPAEHELVAPALLRSQALSIAVTKLQADAFITLDADLAARAREFVDVAPIDVLYRGR